jgi:hypothetical protein
MAFGDDLRGELFKKIGADPTSDPLEKLKLAEKELAAGNHKTGKEIIQSVIELTGANAKRYEEQKQHRSAAESYYIQGLAFGILEDTTERDKNYSKVVNELLEASKSALNFGEDNRGITSITIAGLVCLMSGDEERAFQIYNDGIQAAEQKPNTDVMKRLLFSLGYLLDGLRNTNVGAIADAQNFISTDLKPMLTTSKLLGFTTLLDSVVSHTRQILEDRIKMPKVQLETQVPRDMLYSEIYEVIINIFNSGEGEALDVGYELAIPDKIEIVEGETTGKIGEIQPNANVEQSIKLRLLAGEGLEEIHEITGKITFNDMMQNSHSQSLGPLSLEFRSVSKGSEYSEKLQKATTEFKTVEAKASSAIPISFVQAISKLGETIENHVTNSINAEEFEIAEFGIALVESTGTWADEVIGEGSIAKSIIENITVQIDTAKNQVSQDLKAKHEYNLQEALDKQKAEHKKHLDTEIEKITSNFQLEKERAIIDATEDIERKFAETRAKLAEEHDTELKNQHQVLENKFRQQLTQRESELRNEMSVEIRKKNDEVDEAIREIQSQQVQEIEKEKAELRKEITRKYEGEIELLQSEFQAEKRRLKEQWSESKETEITTLRAKLVQEKNDALDNLKRELEDRHAQDIAEKIDNLNSSHSHMIREKDAKIQGLERRLRDFTSSVEPLDS